MKKLNIKTQPIGLRVNKKTKKDLKMLSKYEIEELQKENENLKEQKKYFIELDKKNTEYFKNELQKLNEENQKLQDENEKLKWEFKITNNKKIKQ